jgi:hypothetical protein
MADGIEVNEDHRPIVMRSFGKCPKSFSLGENFRSFIDRFRMYSDLNQIPVNQRGPLLFTLLDNKAFDTASNLQLDHLENFNHLVEQLIIKFDSPAGAMGNQFKLNSRKQKLNESLLDYMEALMTLARTTNLEGEAQQTKIIETMFEHSRDPKVRSKILKFLNQAQEYHWDDDHRWVQFVELITRINKLSALEAYTATSRNFESDSVFELSKKVDSLMAMQQKQNASKPEVKLLPPTTSNPPSSQIQWTPTSESQVFNNSPRFQPQNSNFSQKVQTNQNGYYNPPFQSNNNARVYNNRSYDSYGNYHNQQNFNPRDQFSQNWNTRNRFPQNRNVQVNYKPPFQRFTPYFRNYNNYRYNPYQNYQPNTFRPQFSQGYSKNFPRGPVRGNSSA